MTGTQRLGWTLALGVLAVAATTWPDFHPEALLGQRYQWWLDVCCHGSFYLVGSLALLWIYRGTALRFWMPVVLFVLSVGLEALQLFIHGRSFDLLDIGSNFGGTALAVLTTILFTKAAAG